jgi:YD repeat-containing protein
MCAAPTGTPPDGAIKAVTTYQGDTVTGGGTTSCGAKNGEICTSANGNGGVTAYAYNSLGQVTTVTPPAPLKASTTIYDAVGRVASTTDGAGRTTTYTYDADDRVTVTNTNAANDPSCTTASDCVVTTYDKNGNVTKTVDASGTTTSSYDTANELTAQALPGAVSRTCAGVNDTALHYSYDPAGNLATYCDAGGTVAYSYDADNHNTGVADPGGNCTSNPVVQPCTAFTYNTLGEQTKATYPTGTGVTTTLGYDNAGNEISIVTAKSGVTTPLVSLTYAYTTSGAATTDTAIRQSVTDRSRPATARMRSMASTTVGSPLFCSQLSEPRINRVSRVWSRRRSRRVALGRGRRAS